MLTLHNIHTITEGIKNVTCNNGKITNIFPGKDHDKNNGIHFYFENAIAFPGLINSHDHLDFNLFPRLGNRIYKNYLEWGSDIHLQNKSIIDNVLKIPQALRTQWGIYKNLLNGVTTVFHHGEELHIENALIDVFQDKNSLHSVHLGKNWKWKLNDPLNKKDPYVIHVGEGTDEQSHKEIDTLLKWNKLHKKLIGIHGVAMDTKQATSFEALVWCPDSNLFLLGATAAIDELKRVTTIVFGTDSTVSAGWSIWNHLRLAKKTGKLTNQELFESVTTSPAKIRGLNNTGAIRENANADIIIAEKKCNNPMDAFFEVNPEAILMILKNGSIILFDEGLLAQKIDPKGFSRFNINGSFKYVKGDLKTLIEQVRNFTTGISFPVEPA